jgi:hypothetical protein
MSSAKTGSAARRAVLAIALGTLLVLVAAQAPAASVASDSLSCTFRGPGYPSLGKRSNPGNNYVVFIKRSLTCDEAKTVALRGARTANPGPFATFRLNGGWSCFSFSPASVGRVIAGQCWKPGTRALLNWSPACNPADRACSNLRKPR